MSIDQRITLSQLIERHGRVRVPIIQRDYAQGRRTEEQVRIEFINRLVYALQLPANDPSLPLNLDFIYGSIEGKTRAFQPLDGQQRLTTLFLMHWYCAWVDGTWDAFDRIFSEDGRSRFTYRVRSSSNEFFDALVQFRPETAATHTPSLLKLIVDQPWYFRSWRLDPTVQSAIVMLESLHAHLNRTQGLFARLISEEYPAITFQLLDLDHFGLSDDLYIKMNARGKPLTPFETFKARYEHELKVADDQTRFNFSGQHFTTADYVSLRMDTAWSDLFWLVRDRTSANYDAALMNVFRAIALITRDVESNQYHEAVNLLRSRYQTNYADFHTGKWLDLPLTMTLIRLLDTWSQGDGVLHEVIPDSPHFREKVIFEKIARQGGDLPYTEVMLFAAYAGYLRQYHDRVDAEVLARWLRVVHNLALNTLYNRAEDLRRSMVGLLVLLPHAEHVEELLVSMDSQVPGFSDKQVEEERLKARLMLADHRWRPLMARAEQHPYFRGQVEFMLSFAGVTEAASASPPSSWDEARHSELQSIFERMLALGYAMFGASGLIQLPDARWQRALLSLGNYMLPSGRNVSFLTNVVTDVEGSWKRYLRGPSPQRDVLAALWKRLESTHPMEAQLDAIIASAANLDDLRQAFVETPEAIQFCENQAIRYQDGRVYLLKRTQRNGAHAELYSFCAGIRLGRRTFEHLSVVYEPVVGTEVPPRISITLKLDKRRPRIYVECRENSFLAYLAVAEADKFAELVPILDSLGMVADDGWHVLSIPRADLDAWCVSLDALLASANDKENVSPASPTPP